MEPVYLRAFGMHVPERVVANDEIAARVERTAAWIESVSGIRERRWAAPETTVADLALAAAQACLAQASVAASDLGLIIVASGSARPGFPGPAVEVAARLGLDATPALDVPVASAGALMGLVMAWRLAPHFGDVLVIGAEKMSAVIETGYGDGPLDPNTAILFGDGAGAALVSTRGGGWEILDAVLHTDGQFRDALAFDWAGPLRMNGLSVIMQAVRKLPSAIEEVLARQGMAAAEVAAFLLHQANQNLLLRVAKSLAVPEERLFSNVARYGNTSSASVLIAAAEWSRQNPPPGPVVFSAFGAGFHWGALLARGTAI
jgi:3-oxoacyl-[acyl-carrier-protein] synthase III